MDYETSIDELWLDNNMSILGSIIKIDRKSDDNSSYVLSTKIEDTINLTGLLVSLPFLIVTFLTYSCVSELKNNRGSVLMIRYIGCLSFAFGFLICIKLNLVESSKHLCISTGIGCYYFFFASFLWSNVMSYDIWRTIGCVTSMQNRGFKSERMRLFIYSFYVWGSTLILTMAIVIVDYSPKIKYFQKPGLNNVYCWFESTNSAAEYIYFTGPMGLIILSNIIFFILTFIKTREIRRNIKQHSSGEDNQCHDDNGHWCYLCFKLSIVMGIGWSFEVLSKIFSKDNEWLWLIFESFNAFQGLTIFIIFVCLGVPKQLLVKQISHVNSSMVNQGAINQGENKSRGPKA